MLETSAFRIPVRRSIYIINSVDKTNFLCTPCPPTQHHNFVRNYPVYSREERLFYSNFWTRTGVRQAIPLNLRTPPPTFSAILDFENLKCRDHYRFFMKCKYEKPKKWAKLREEFDLEDQHIAEAFLLPIRVSSEP